MAAPLSVEDYRQLAKARLPRFLYDYVEGGADTEDAVALNRASFQRWRIVPRVLRGVSAPSTTVDLFGRTWSLPLAIAPTGLNGFLRPFADQDLAKVAAQNGVPFVLSTAANASLEQATHAAGEPPWFQLYVMDRAVALRQVKQAYDLGCPALVLTVDVPIGGNRFRDRRNGFLPGAQLSSAILKDTILRPRWALSQFLAPRARLLPMLLADDQALTQDLRARRFDMTLDWDFVRRLRDMWKRPLLIKGILDPRDAMAAVEAGVDGVIVSNHGGRQLNAAPSTLAMLPIICAAVGASMPVLLDGGIRTGEDIVKTLALGASGIMIGRAALYGLAADGTRGAQGVFDILRGELQAALILSGSRGIADLDTSILVREPLC